MKAWLFPVTALQLGDLLVSGSSGISFEANPLMKYIWAEFGFFPLIVIKAVCVGLFYLAILVCTHENNPYRKVFTVLAKTMLTCSTLVLLVVVVWNLTQVL